MKKSLIALAALAATGAFAQSSVTISGNLDFAGANVSGTQTWATGSTVSTTVGTSSTSVLNIVAVEDLGGGMKATAKLGLDPRSLSNDNLAVTNNTGVAVNNATVLTGSLASTGATVNTVGVVSGQANTVTGLGRDEAFVGIEGAFGNLRLGSPNSIGLNSFLVSSALGTGIGGGFSGGGTSGTMTNSFVQIRYNRSVRWDSPVVNGFSASVLYAPGNDVTATTTASVTSTGAANPGQVVPALPVASLIINAREATEFGLRYSNGPLTVSYANIAQAAQVNSQGWYTNASSSKGLKTSMNVLDAAYTMGATTVSLGLNNGQRLAALAGSTAATDSKGYRLAVRHTIGAIGLGAQYTQQTAMGVVANVAAGPTNAELKASVMGVRADYSLSKTAVAYLGYEKYDTGNAYVASAPTTTGTRNIVSLGLRKSF